MASRDRERFWAMARVGAQRLWARARTVLLTDPGQATGFEEAVASAELARSAGTLKGGMAKLAQLMGYAEGPGAAVDAEARAALGRLWDHVPPVPAEAVRQVIAQDLGAPPEALFAAWEEVPMAAASLGQVHGAVGKNGARYAVKVQYPGIADALRADLASRSLLRGLAGAGVGRMLAPEALETLRAAVLAEVDYTAEGRAMQAFGRAFAGDPGILVPAWIEALSSPRVLTMERMVGRPLAACADDDQDMRDTVGALIFRFAWAGPLCHGLVHADPNPGNYLVVDNIWDGTGDRGEPGDEAVQVAFLDYGCTAALDADARARDRALFRAFLHHDPFEAAERFRLALHEQGMVRRAEMFFQEGYRVWERLFLAPFAAGGAGGFAWSSEYARRLAEATSTLVAGGDLRLPAPVVLLWRQRLAAAAVIGRLAPRCDFRAMLADMLGDGARQ